MGSKPKKSDYEPGPDEIANAYVARKQHEHFKQNYGPLLLKMRDEAKNKNFRDVIRGRNSADVAQMLTTKLDFNAAQNIPNMASLAGAHSAALSDADAAALDVKNTLSSGVVGVATGQAADATIGMSRAAHLEANQRVIEAQASQQVSESKLAAGVQIAGATMLGYADKKMRERQAAQGQSSIPSTGVGSIARDRYNPRNFPRRGTSLAEPLPTQYWSSGWKD